MPIIACLSLGHKKNSAEIYYVTPAKALVALLSLKKKEPVKAPFLFIILR